MDHFAGAWCEEAYELQDKERDFDKIDLSLRGKLEGDLFKRIILSFNPWYDFWIKDRFFDGKNDKRVEKDNSIAFTTTYKDNPYLGEDDLQLFDEMKERFPKRYAIEGEGDWGVSEGLIFENWKELAFDWEELIKQRDFELSVGLDFGYTNDPTGFICSVVNEKKKELYIFEEHYRTKMLNSDIADMIIRKGFAKDEIIADSAEPKSIEELRKLGIRRIKGARKGKDSILNGIQLIQGFDIYVHPKCVNTIMELSNYQWEEKKEGGRINKPLDKYNHLIDALRYSLEKFGKNNKIRATRRI